MRTSSPAAVNLGHDVLGPPDSIGYRVDCGRKAANLVAETRPCPIGFSGKDATNVLPIARISTYINDFVCMEDHHGITHRQNSF
jgi:hypothetical protein